MAPTPSWHRRRREAPVETEVIERLLDYTRAAHIGDHRLNQRFHLEDAALRISSRKAERVLDSHQFSTKRGAARRLS
jgi:hypothetical protein